MINARKFRSWVFNSHKIIGLIVGLILVITGLTGSALVFQREIVDAQVVAQYGKVIPQGEMVAVETIVNNIKTAYANQPDLQLISILRKPIADAPYRATLKSPDEEFTSVWVNPYTGAIMGSVQNNNTWVFITFKLHYELLAGANGEIVMGVMAGLLFILCITGIVLWPGWRKLAVGFKIKWKAHPLRTNYDLHKVAGIITAVFLAFTAFTGFCWNFNTWTTPVIYALTGTPTPPKPLSTVIKQPPLSVTEISQKADAALPGAATTQISFPLKPDGAYRIRKKFPEEDWHFGRSFVFLDQYTGKVLQIKNGLNPTLGDKVLATFTPLHYGTFWGLPSRILYVFVGLAPLILFVTGFIMSWYRRPKPAKKS